MNHKSDIINYYKKKIDLLKKHNQVHFNKDNPKITDSQYDDLQNEAFD